MVRAARAAARARSHGWPRRVGLARSLASSPLSTRRLPRRGKLTTTTIPSRGIYRRYRPHFAGAARRHRPRRCHVSKRTAVLARGDSTVLARRAARCDLRRGRRRVASCRSVLADRHTRRTARCAVLGRRNAGAPPSTPHPPRQRAGHPPRPGFARPPRPAPPCCCCDDVPSTWQALLGPLLLGTASTRPWTSTAAPALAALACATLIYVSRCRPALDDSFWIERISPRGELYSANVRTGAVSAGGARAHAASETRALLRALREVQTPLLRRFINRLRGTSTADEERGCAGMGVRIVGDCAQPDVRLSAVRAHADALLVVDCLVREQVIDI